MAGLIAEDPARAAALNNAIWCDAVCRAAGGTTSFEAGLWRHAGTSPPFFPNIVTTERATGTAAVVGALRGIAPGRRPVAVKDSFCTLDLAPLGFSLLFEARWLRRDPPLAETVAALQWTRADSPTALRQWQAAGWPEGQAPVFDPALLACPDVAFLAGHDGTACVAGAAVTETAGVVGLACTFFRGDDPQALRADLLAHVARRYPGRAIVGYESGDELRAMQALGLRDIGPLRVWVCPASPAA